MQSTGHLLSAARLALPAAGRAAASSTLFASPSFCLRCGRSVSVTPSMSPSVRFFARKAKQPTDTQPASRRNKRAAGSSNGGNSGSGAVEQRPNEGNSADSRDALMRLVAQLPAADLPAAIEALNQRLTSQKQPSTPKTAQAEVIQAEVEVEEEDEEGGEEDEEDEEWDENEAEYAQLRARLAKEGVIRTEAGEEIMSMEEVERQLKEGGGPEDDEEEFVMAEEEDDEEDMDEREHEDEQHTVEAEDDQPNLQRPAASSSSSTANTFWIQEHRDGTVTVTEWPADDDDTDDTADLAHSYDLNMPPSSDQSAIVGQAIGGEKLNRADVLQMREKDLQEHFTKGGGRGGQKVNKSSNCVHLHHLPTGTIVKCHATRSLAENRRIAREIMQGRLEELVLGPASRNGKRAAKIRKQKAKGRRRAAVKYGDVDESEGGSDTVDATVVKQHSDSGGSDSK